MTQGNRAGESRLRDHDPQGWRAWTGTIGLLEPYLLVLMMAANILIPAYGGIGRRTAVDTASFLAPAWRWDERLAQLPLVRALGSIGGVFYSLYLIRVPVLSPIENPLGRWIPSLSPWFVAVWGGAMGAALIGGVLLNRFVERPLEHWRRRTLAIARRSPDEQMEYSS